MNQSALPGPRGWRAEPPPDRAWKPRPGMDPAARSAEQDRAAGGRERRFVALENGRHARASIALRLLPRTRRVRAYLRWSDSNRTRERYVCEAQESTRSANLRHAWEIARAEGMVVDRPRDEGSWASSPATRAVMVANRGRDTGPELRLRKLLHAKGLRYRVNIPPLRGLRRTADVVFTKAKVAVFVDGCFWHGCPEHHRPANRNGVFWREKINGNQARDRDTDRALSEAGWRVVRVWEHEDAETAADRIATILRSHA